VTRIELAPSAWESVSSPQFRAAELDIRVPASDRDCLSLPEANGMAILAWLLVLLAGQREPSLIAI
jgi:hypothetical protein